MKKIGIILTALVAIALIWFTGTVGAAEAVTSEASSVVVTASVILGVILTAIAGIWAALRCKKGRPDRVRRYSVKAINAAMVLSMMVANTRHDYTNCKIATSPKTLTKIYKTNLGSTE
jgi:type VI protein secretion system component VasK